MIQRNIVRVRREHGFKYFALPLIVLLMLAVLADQWLADYGDRRAEANELQATLNQQRAILDLQPKIAANEERLKPLYGALEPRLFMADDPRQSLQSLENQLFQILQGLYFDPPQFSDKIETSAGSITRLSLTARFTGVPQQLERLQSALSQAPKHIMIDRLDIEVIPDPQRGGQQLAITARFSALHVKSAAAPVLPASSPAASKP
ncbi:MAG: hypothetical protein E6Q94_04620 [Burkholderiaceae bacterium]|nr:MAG: hypothetical protein E6Q94_04620 [Burkholderiaceae bacterium]